MSVTASVVVSTAGLDRLIAGMAARITAVIAEYAELIRQRADELAPERTGADRATIHAILEAFAARISIGEGLSPPYGMFQELGFVHHWSHAFIQNPALRPALEQYAEPFIVAVRAAVFGG